MGTHRQPSMAATSPLRMKATPCPVELGHGHYWQLELMVRGERVRGTLFAPEREEPEPGLLVWVHGRTGREADPPIPSQPSALLELHWPLVGPRHDPKLSPLLTQCLTETTRSEALDALWQRFAHQAASEVGAVLTAVRSQKELRIGPLTELRLDLALAGRPPAHRAWGPQADAATDWPGRVLDFLQTMRSTDSA